MSDGANAEPGGRLERLEAAVERLEAENERLRERLAAVENGSTGTDEGGTDRGTPVSRRATLTGLATLGLFGTAGQAAATTGDGGGDGVDDAGPDEPDTVDGVGALGSIRTADPMRLYVDDEVLGHLTTAGQPDDHTEAGNVFFGNLANVLASAPDSTIGATVSGGGGLGEDTEGPGGPNRVLADYGTVSGGADNQAGKDDAEEATQGATVGGGTNNAATGGWATVAGGVHNRATANTATVPGGYRNEAAGIASLAAGRRARARHRGSFVWSGGEEGSFGSTGEGQFLVDAPGGVGVGTDSPDADLDVDGDATVAGDLTVEGSVDEGKVGVSVWENAFQTIPSDGQEHEITWGGTWFDDFGWMQSDRKTMAIAGPVTVRIEVKISWETLARNQKYAFHLREAQLGPRDAVGGRTESIADGFQHMSELFRIPEGETREFFVTGYLQGFVDHDIEHDSTFTAIKVD